jgi:hypothetical protein
VIHLSQTLRELDALIYKLLNVTYLYAYNITPTYKSKYTSTPRTVRCHQIFVILVELDVDFTTVLYDTKVLDIIHLWLHL